MSTAAFNRAQNDIARWVKDPRIPIDQQGADFLVSCLDPCHDTILGSLDGWPDLENGASITRCIKQSIEISGTSGGGSVPTGPWDCHFNLNPFLDTGVSFTQSLTRANTYMTYSAATMLTSPVGGLTATASFVAGSAVSPLTAPATSRLGQLGLPPTYSNGLGRVTGIAFEVVDTTSQLNKQGSCMCWRQNASEATTPTMVTGCNPNTTPPTMFWTNCMPLQQPPTTLSSAQLIPGSRIWEAREGCYVVGNFHSAENPPVEPSYVQPLFVDDVMSTTNNSPMYLPNQCVALGGPSTLQIATHFPTKIYPFHQCGAIFAGLHPLATLRVTLVIYYESFPTVSPEDQPILVMATPSMPYNPYLLELLAHAMRNQPVGVMFKENGLGTWFATAVKAASKYLSAPASLVHPLLGMAVKTAGDVANGYLQPAGQPKRVAGKPKKTKNHNSKLAEGNRGKKRVQGPKPQGKSRSKKNTANPSWNTGSYGS